MKTNELYRIYAIFMGKDLNHEVTMGYLVTDSGDEEVYKTLSGILQYDDYEEGWGFSYGEDGGKRIIKKRGDYDEDYLGEFYDIKYRWEKVKKISEDEVKVLKKFNVLELGRPEYFWRDRLKKVV